MTEKTSDGTEDGKLRRGEAARVHSRLEPHFVMSTTSMEVEMMVTLPPRALSHDYMDHVIRCANYQWRRSRVNEWVIERVDSVRDVRAQAMDHDTMRTICAVRGTCTVYHLAVNDRLDLEIQTDSSAGWYGDFGPFRVFVPRETGAPSVPSGLSQRSPSVVPVVIVSVSDDPDPSTGWYQACAIPSASQSVT